MFTENSRQFLEDFTAGKASRAQDYLGSHLTESGAIFRVWAPNAVEVYVAGSFNNWNDKAARMSYLSGGI